MTARPGAWPGRAVRTCGLAGVSIVLAASCGARPPVLTPEGPPAETIAGVTWLFFGVCAVVYVMTLAALLWAILRRRLDSDDSQQTARRLSLAVAGAVGLSAATLVVLTVVSVAAGRGLTSPQGPPVLTVKVTGHQWWWDFRYDEPGSNAVVSSPNELHLPVGVPVTIEAASADVIHSLWVPNLQGKRDLVPGMTTYTWIQADRPGVYRGQCAEFCGHQHAHMAFLVIAEPREQFDAWLAGQRASSVSPASEAARRGHDQFMRGPCVMCHTIRGTAAGSRIGPDLTHVASRRTLAAGTLPMTRGHLAGWIADPQSIKPGSRMPPNLVRGADLQALVSYLETLR